MTPARVEAAGVELAYEETGSGPSVVLVHGTATARTIWDETVAALGDDVRSLAYDRRAYGDSGAPESYRATTVGEQADDLAALIRALGAAPAVLCGHDVGASICLEVLLRHGDLVRGAVLIEPSMLWLSSDGSETMSAIREAVEAGAREDGPAGAVSAYLEAVGGDLSLELIGPERAAAARAAPAAFAADLAASTGWSAPRRELRAIAHEVKLMCGAGPRSHAEATRALSHLIPRATLRELDTGHYVQLEQPAAVARELRSLSGAQ